MATPNGTNTAHGPAPVKPQHTDEGAIGNTSRALGALRHLAIMGAALATVIMTPAPTRQALIIRIVLAALVVAIDLLGIRNRTVTAKGPPTLTLLDPVLLLALGCINPAAFVPIAIAAVVCYQTALAPVLLHIPMALCQLAMLAFVGLLGRTHPNYLQVLAPIAAGDLAKAGLVQLWSRKTSAAGLQYSEVMSGARALIWRAQSNGPEGGIAIDPAADAFLGYGPECWADPAFLERITHPEDRGLLQRLIAETAQAAAGSVPVGAKPTGTSSPIGSTGAPGGPNGAPDAPGGRSEGVIRLNDATGKEWHFLFRVVPNSTAETPAADRTARGLLIDISDRVAAESELRRYAEVTSTSPLGCLLLGTSDANAQDLQVRFANEIALSQLRLDTSRVSAGLPLAEVFGAATADLLQRVLTDVLRTGNPMSAERMAFSDFPDEFFNLRADRLSDGTVAVTFENVTAAVRVEERLRHQAMHDALTGLPNRVELDEHLRDAVEDAQRTGHRMALLLMDLTQFKEVNDAMGHRTGDQLLVEIATRLRETLAPHFRLIARLGGDEFALLSPPLTGEDEAVELARRALGTLERPFEVDGIPLQSSANIGVALCPDHGDTGEALLKAADVAMYRAKRTGQGLEVYSTERDQSSLRRVTLLGELRRAMASGELQLRYQPAVDLRTGAVTKVEALVRWNHQHHGLMLPIEFIELAESSGMIHPLTRWIIAEASRGANKMHAQNIPLKVSANISVRNLQDPDLVSFFELLARTDDFYPERLELEITETELMEDPVRAFEVLDRLRSLGLGAAVDDFGIGHSSLAYLKHMPVSHLKIDRGFVTTISTDAGDAAIVRSTIDLAHSLGLHVTAEGVPDEPTLRLLAEFGCDYAQGFFISQPIVLDDLPAEVHSLNHRMPRLLGLGPQGDLHSPAGSNGHRDTSPTVAAVQSIAAYGRSETLTPAPIDLVQAVTNYANSTSTGTVIRDSTGPVPTITPVIPVVEQRQ